MRERIANVASSTRNETYTVSRHNDRHVWECSCLGWTRHVPRRDCRHVDEARAVVEHGASIRAVVLCPAGEALRASMAKPAISASLVPAQPSHADAGLTTAPSSPAALAARPARPAIGPAAETGSVDPWRARCRLLEID
jgi:hypothetical protein